VNLSSASLWALDTEYFGPTQTLAGYSFANEQGSEFVLTRDKPRDEALAEWLATPTNTAVAWNISADINSLEANGYTIQCMFMDAMVAVWLANLVWRTAEYGQKDVEEVLLGIKRRDYSDLVRDFVSPEQIVARFPEAKPFLTRTQVATKPEIVAHIMAKYPGVYKKTHLAKRDKADLLATFPTAGELAQTCYIAKKQTLATLRQYGMGVLDEANIRPYAQDDARYCWQLWKLAEASLKQQNLWDVFTHVYVPYCQALANMQRLGVQLNVDYLTAQAPKLAAGMDAANAAFYESFAEYIGKKAAIERLCEAGTWTPAERTPAGAPSINKRFLAAEAPKRTPGGLAARLWREYKLREKCKSTYCEGLLVAAKEGRCSSRLRVTSDTGRTLSAEPNLQNQIKETVDEFNVRSAFRATEGWRMFSADFSQIEMLVAAHFSQDPLLVSVIRDGKSHHDLTAAKMGIPRDKAKQLNFSLLYLGGAPTVIRQGIASNYDEAQQLVDGWQAAHQGLMDFYQKVIQFCEVNGYVLTLLGRKRMIPLNDASWQPTAYELVQKMTQKTCTKAQATRKLQAAHRRHLERQCANTPIQGSAADIFMLATNRVSARWKGQEDRKRLLLPVHDELVGEVRPEFEAEARRELEEEMVNVVSLSLPLKADIKFGQTWLECK